MRLILICLALVTSVAAQQAPAPLLSRQQLAELDTYIEQARQQWELPGLSIAIVQGDSIVLAKGFGVRELGKADPVDEHTLFGIGSNGKTFTSALAAMMVDAGKLRWDDPVDKYLPTFRVGDPYVSQNATLRDALSHRTGVAGPLAFYYGAPLTAPQIIERMRLLPQETGFRSTFNYSNLMYMIAGEVAAAVAGRTWGDLLHERIYAPLGMTRSVRSGRRRLEGLRNVASAHMTGRDGRLVVVPNIEGEAMAPSGAPFSTAHDMAQWLRLQLGNGVYAGRRLISERSMAEMRTVVTATPFGSNEARTGFGYGLGWFIGTYRGQRALWHGGGVDGMTSDMQLLPEAQVGVVVLTNSSSNSLHRVITQHVFDLVLGLPPRDWNAEALASARRQREAEAKRQAALEAQRFSAPPTWPLERYAGRYVDSLMGEVTVLVQGGRLLARYHPGYEASLAPWSLNTFRMEWRNPSAVQPPFATFHQNPAGGPLELEIAGVGRFRPARN